MFHDDERSAGDDDSESDSEATVDPEKDEEEDLASKQRKRAGVPELELDQKPSTIAQKMMNLITKVVRVGQLDKCT